MGAPWAPKEALDRVPLKRAAIGLVGRVALVRPPHIIAWHVREASAHDANATQLCECGCGVARGATIDTINGSVALGVSAAEP